MSNPLIGWNAPRIFALAYGLSALLSYPMLSIVLATDPEAAVAWAGFDSPQRALNLILATTVAFPIGGGLAIGLVKLCEYFSGRRAIWFRSV
jgi:hypothetical protein